ncbi:uncharacterized protein LAESUDRAFT_725236 [Laetiporus sulphureus 93-53]|uniref:BTB domain-containing protein n=1 Tax=Laetiporus sulphureus 93-53 TaxID=1314785 RepID=A0A165ELQ8_9APHY|nr:uncharacterized protein LAESUDRAFT_725236 [Laetiporus sulphureus 93-53]KZT07319.1 hypothetical protein LAESUDRAFT_725236 [Laetiporus sulphureus 93-53]
MSRIATTPFDRSDADVILRAADLVEFRVHKNILAISSSFFETMFSLPQSRQEVGKALPVVPVTERSATIDTLLRIIYPVRNPFIASVKLAHDTLEAALKYDMVVAADYTKQELSGFIYTEPLRVFAIACIHGLEKIAKKAADEAVTRGTIAGSYVPELEHISAACYHRLLQYERVTAKERISFEFCRSQTTKEDPSKPKVTAPSDDHSPAYLFNEAADVEIVTSDKVRFRVNGDIISLASPVLCDKLLKARRETKHYALHGIATGRTRSVLTVPEQSSTMKALLQLCYPSDMPVLSDQSILISVFCAAKTYEMKRAVDLLWGKWSEFTSSNPLLSFFIASSIEYREATTLAAKALLSKTRSELKTTYIDYMEIAKAGPYYRLLEYHKSCCRVARDLLYSRSSLSQQFRDKVNAMRCRHHTHAVSSVPAIASSSVEPDWARAYLSSAKELLAVLPDASVARSDAVLGELLLQYTTSACSSCRKKAGLAIGVCTALENEIEKAITKVKFESD